MKIAHIGPALARRGGPAGYLLQLSLAAERFGKGSEYQLTFPAHETPAPVATRTAPGSAAPTLSRTRKLRWPSCARSRSTLRNWPGAA